eukprot:COSAG01_NODE_2816_length_7019_cov_22.384682_7_plen_85_part_00
MLTVQRKGSCLDCYSDPEYSLNENPKHYLNSNRNHNHNQNLTVWKNLLQLKLQRHHLQKGPHADYLTAHLTLLHQMSSRILLQT